MNVNVRSLVAVSSLAFFAMPIGYANAQVTITCTQNISFGTILPNCTGSITVRATPADGTTNNGCHTLIGGVIRPAICNIITTMVTATMNARITFSTALVQFNNTTAGGQVTLDNYRLQTAGGSQLNTFTYNNTLLNPTHTIKVGGRLRFDAGEANGSYNGGVDIIVTSVP
ncbi:MAG: DUF4402 domain-containing protein [Pseudomonadota bacterium]